MKNPLLDTNFLKELDLHPQKEVYAKIISLNLDEEPLQEISGAVTGGSLSIDGNSAIRRTCSLTMTSSEVNINNFYWGLHTKFKLYIGLKNFIDDKYPEVIWFPEGTFAITSFTTSRTVNAFTINITGKDKMCYLNGELGGVIPALTWDFGTYDYIDEDGTVTNVSQVIKDIIRDAVHEFAHEPYHNIIINDLDDYGIELLEYRGKDPLYFLIDSLTGEVVNAFLDPAVNDSISLEPDIYTKITDESTLMNLKRMRDIEEAQELMEGSLEKDVQNTFENFLNKKEECFISENSFTRLLEEKAISWATSQNSSFDDSKVKEKLAKINEAAFAKTKSDYLTQTMLRLQQEANAYKSVLYAEQDALSSEEVSAKLDVLDSAQKVFSNLTSYNRKVTPAEYQTIMDYQAVYHDILEEDTSSWESFFENNFNEETQFYEIDTKALKVLQGNSSVIEEKIAAEDVTDNYYQNYLSREKIRGEIEALTKSREKKEISYSGYVSKRDELSNKIQNTLLSTNLDIAMAKLNVETLFEETRERIKLIANAESFPSSATVLNVTNLNYDPEKDVLNYADTLSYYLAESYRKVFAEEVAGIKDIDEAADISPLLVALENPNFSFDPLFELDLNQSSSKPTLITNGTNYQQIAKVEYGQTAGYRLTDLTYAGDLICNAGESITSMLDKIVKMLGDFEYFYDVDGHFVFQRKKTYTNTSWNNLVANNVEEIYAENAAYTSAISYFFEDSKMIISFNNTPNLSNLKNDFSIWGTRKGVTGADIPVHMRYAIDRKPTVYKTFDGICYTTATSVDELIELLPDEAVDDHVFSKTPNVVNLSEDWWELKDFATYYRLYFGYYPTKILDYYAESINMTWSDIGPLHQNAGWIVTNYPTVYTNNIIFQDDLVHSIHWTFRNGRPEGYCSHTYQDWLKLLRDTPGLSVYFYRPRLIDANGNGPPKKDPDEEYVPVEEIVIDNSKMVLGVDWRELIYQMAKDYRKHNRDNDFALKLYKNNPDFVKNGLTGYEQYYVDLEGFWRQLYNPEYRGTFEPINFSLLNLSKDDWDTEINDSSFFFSRPIYKQCSSMDMYSSAVTYYTCSENLISITNEDELEDYEAHRTVISQFIDPVDKKEIPLTQKLTIGDIFVKRIYTAADVTKNTFYEDPEEYYYATNDFEYLFYKWYFEKGDYDPNASYFYKSEINDFNLDGSSNSKYWLTSLTTSPETINFWFDFLDSNGSDLNNFSVSAVGDRPKSANDNTVKAIYFRETPNVIFVESADWVNQYQVKSGYSYIQLGAGMDNLFSISSQGKSAKDVLDEWLYNYAYCAETTNITALPVYYLQPNTRAYIRDNESGINGEYIISKITLPLSAKGNMSISATKAVDRIY